MTYKESSGRVATLCLDSEATTGSLLLTATNLALSQIYADCPVTRTVRLTARGIRPLLYHKQIVCKNGGPLEIEMPGAAYSFKILGSCQMSIINGDGRVTESIDTGKETKIYKGICNIGSRMLFYGNFTFSLYDFSVYEEIFSLDPEDIPDPGPTTSYDLRAMYGDFLSFHSPAEDGDGNALDCCRLSDGRLEVDSTYCGEIAVTYNRIPTMCDGSGDGEVDLPDEYISAYTYLVASILLLGDHEKIAVHYRERYEELISALKSTGYSRVGGDYLITDGWA